MLPGKVHIDEYPTVTVLENTPSDDYRTGIFRPELRQSIGFMLELPKSFAYAPVNGTIAGHVR